jgi:hypothetical protein
VSTRRAAAFASSSATNHRVTVFDVLGTRFSDCSGGVSTCWRLARGGDLGYAAGIEELRRFRTECSRRLEDHQTAEGFEPVKSVNFTVANRT